MPCVWEALRNPITQFQLRQTQGHLIEVASCTLSRLLFISYACLIWILNNPFWGSFSYAHALSLYFSLTLHASHVNPERGVESKGWEMHCQPAEHETLCVLRFEKMESVLTPSEGCRFLAESRRSWTNLLWIWQINNNPPTSASLHPFTLTILSAWKHLPWDVHVVVLTVHSGLFGRH